MKKLFNQYQKIKDNFILNYKDYPLEKILSLEIISLVYNKKRLTVKDLFWIFFYYKINIPNSKNKLFSIGRYKRDDYYELLEYTRSNMQSELLDLSKIDKSFKFSIKHILFSFRHIFIAKQVNLKFTQKLSLMITTVSMLNTIDELEKNKPTNIISFCSFCSMLNYEALLDFYFQKNNIPTYTLQHGLWFIYDKYPIDLITYENFIANKLLCWGEYTKDEFIKFGIEEEKLEVSGYPRKINRLSKNTNKISEYKILVLFARIEYHKNNVKIINLLKQLKLQFNIEVEFKLHPSLNSDLYKNIAKQYGFKIASTKTIKELLHSNQYTFSIVYNSTAYYDSYINNCICLRYKDNEADNSIDVWDDSFKSLNELIKKIRYFDIKNKEQKFWDETEDKLAYILGYGINKYKEFLDVK